ATDNSVTDAGAVIIYYGKASGLSQDTPQPQTLSLPLASRGGNLAQAGARFGSALAAGDFDGDGFTDLAVGVPFEDVGTATDAGAIGVGRGSATGILAGSPELITQDSTLSGGGVGDRAGAGRQVCLGL